MAPSPAATRLVRFIDENGATRCGQPDSSDVSTITSALLVEGDDPIGSRIFTGEKAIVKQLLPPVQPAQILAIGLNYHQHAKETKQPVPKSPVVFTKGLNTVQRPKGPIVIPSSATDPPEVDYECELAVVISKDCRDISEEDALRFVAGYVCANDVSARRWQLEHEDLWRAKNFDTFCPLGPILVTPEEISDPQALAITTRVNGELMQSSTTRDMVFSVARLISTLSNGITLPRGTVILTGTPAVRCLIMNPNASTSN